MTTEITPPKRRKSRKFFGHQMNFMLDERTFGEVARIAKERGMSMGSLVRECVVGYLNVGVYLLEIKTLSDDLVALKKRVQMVETEKANG